MSDRGARSLRHMMFEKWFVIDVRIGQFGDTSSLRSTNKYYNHATSGIEVSSGSPKDMGPAGLLRAAYSWRMRST